MKGPSAAVLISLFVCASNVLDCRYSKKSIFVPGVLLSVVPNRYELIRRKTLLNDFKGCGFDAKSFYPCFGLAEATLFVTGGVNGSGVKSIVIEPDALGGNSVRITNEGGCCWLGLCKTITKS